MEGADSWHLHAWAEAKVSAVVDETALRSSLEGWASSQRSEPGHQRGGTSERVDYELRLDLLAAIGASPGNGNAARDVSRYKPDHPCVGDEVDVGFALHGSPERAFEHCAASPDRDEQLILRLRSPR